ncbi:hypothetical protein IW967_12390 [Alicyclobacillus mali]|uniref:Uncharacterized protein n=1 Tax=Alicyclobacillus mali (ex Roth et al. 2021) TaxID=1123961 RepID=A0ABS0F5U2_9BACL|nr:hypothetical protein [Alicyclobacillus mali (ex Roth et al. 2021)]MBF8378654.1 hypothetical protein [Alicyclobacillus mali (ex Roth et al. 2021)]MCL6487479.1 hypothetical protein [Alicyclobacillus mali (ex Roth et al. 2021)]
MDSDKLHYVLVLDRSRKARSLRQLYEAVVADRAEDARLEVSIGDIRGQSGIELRERDRHRVLSLRLQDEHMSPYCQTNMNLFQLLMLDERTEMSIYRAQRAWLLVFRGVTSGPRPFGTQGYDPR